MLTRNLHDAFSESDPRVRAAIAEISGPFGMSALPLKADMCSATRDVRFVPIAEIKSSPCTTLKLRDIARACRR